jgi:hypothetical protein
MPVNGSATRIFVYRRGPAAVGLDLHELDVTTAWERLSANAQKAMLDELGTRLAAVPEDHWTHYRQQPAIWI